MSPLAAAGRPHAFSSSSPSSSSHGRVRGHSRGARTRSTARDAPDIASFSSSEAGPSLRDEADLTPEEEEEEELAPGEGEYVGIEVDDGFPTVRLDLPTPENVKIRTAEFVKSSVEVEQCPKEGPPEFAIIGRSNVGKSSLINMLTGRRSLAQVSKAPGKTQCINHFIINGGWYLVDMPGYGYAKRSKEQRRVFDTFTRSYFKRRSTLVMVLLLVDCSVPPQAVDLEYATWLATNQVPFSIVFTKADKRKKGAPRCAENVAGFKRALLEDQGFPLLPPSVVTSAAVGGGKMELLNFIASLRIMWEQGGRK